MVTETIKAELQLAADQFSSTIGDATKSLGTLESKSNSANKAIAGLGVAMAGLSVAALGKSVKAAANFEEAMAGVEKVTDPETAERMGEAIKDLAAEAPLAHEELAQIAETAGKLGVPSDEIEGFTENVAKMAASTDLAAEEAADAFARISTLMDIPMEKSEELGSAINELANNFGTSASEITDVMTRAGGAFNALGLAEDQALGLAAAMNEVSPSSRLAAGGLQRMSEALLDPGNVEDIADALGMTTEEFQSIIDENPQEAIFMVAEAMNEGGEASTQLRQDLGKVAGEFGTLGQNTDAAKEATEDAAGQFENATSLTEEFETVAGTFNSQMQIMRNRLHNLAIDIGTVVLPYVAAFMSHVSDLLELIIDLNAKFGGMPAVLALVGSLIAGVAMAAGSLAAILTGTGAAAAAASGAIAGLSAAFGLLTMPISLATTVISGFVSASMGAMSALLALPSAAASAAIGFGSTLVGAVSSAIASLLAFPGAAAAAIASKLSMVAASVTSAVASFSLAGAYSALQTAALVAATGVRALTVSLLTMAAPIAAIALLAAGLYAAWKTNFLGIKDITDELVSFVKAIISGDFAAAGDTMGNIAARVRELWDTHVPPILATIRNVINRIQTDVIAPFLAWFVPIWEKHLAVIKEELALTAEAWIRDISAFIEWAKPYVSAFLDMLSAWWGEHGDEVMAVLEKLIPVIEGAFKTIVDIAVFFLRLLRLDFAGAADALISIAERLAGGIVDVFRWLYNKLIGNSIIPDMLNDILSFIEDFSLIDAGKALIDEFIEGIEAKADAALEASKKLLKNIRDLWPFSDAKEGPLDDVSTIGPTFVSMIAEGMQSKEGLAVSASEDIAQAARPEPTAAIPDVPAARGSPDGGSGGDIIFDFGNIDDDALIRVGDIKEMVEDWDRKRAQPTDKKL